MDDEAAVHALGERYIAMLYEAVATMNTERCPYCDRLLRRVHTAANQMARLACDHCRESYFDDGGPITHQHRDVH